MRKALIVVAQDPYIDPRISYEAESLHKLGYDVEVFGFLNKERTSKKNFSSNIKITEFEPNNAKAFASGIKSLGIFLNDLGLKHYLLMLVGLPLVLALDISIGLCLGILVLIKNLPNILLSKTIILKRVLKLFIILIKPKTFKKPNFQLRFISSFHRLMTLVHPNLVLIGAYKQIYSNKKFDLVVCCDLDTLMAGAYIKKTTNTRLVYDSHELWPYVYTDAYWLDTQLLSGLEGLFIRYADSVITVSNYIKNILDGLYRHPHIAVIPNVEPLEDTIQPIQNNKVNEDTINFLFIGGFAPGRGIELLIRNWQQLVLKNDLNFNLLIQGPNNIYKTQYMNLARNTGLLGKRIFFPESVSEDKIIESCKSADVGIIPYEPICLSHIGCSPNKLGQYMKAGLPILSNKLEHVSEVLSVSKAGFICDFTDQDEFIKYALNFKSSEDRKKMSENALIYAQQKYNWEAYSQVFKAALGK